MSRNLRDIIRSVIWDNQDELWEEWYNWSSLALLRFIQIVTELTPWIVSIAFVGQIGSKELAALSLVEVWVNSFLDITWSGIGKSTTTPRPHVKKIYVF